MFSFSEQMKSIIVLNFSLGERAVDKVTNTVLLNLADMAHRFKHRGSHLEKRLEKLRMA